MKNHLCSKNIQTDFEDLKEVAKCTYILNFFAPTSVTRQNFTESGHTVFGGHKNGRFLSLDEVSIKHIMLRCGPFLHIVSKQVVRSGGCQLSDSSKVFGKPLEMVCMQMYFPFWDNVFGTMLYPRFMDRISSKF
jgi:hypothetical protein